MDGVIGESHVTEGPVDSIIVPTRIVSVESAQEARARMRDTLIAKLMLNVNAAAISPRSVTRRLGRLLANHFLTSQERVAMQVKGGMAQGLWFDLNPRTDNHYYRGIVEQPVQHALRRMARPGMVAYDIGANIGFFTLLIHRLVGESGQVFAFEPDPETFGELSKNVTRNGCQNITTVQTAVWSSTGSVRFSRADPMQSPGRGTGSVRENATGDVVICESISLDDFVQGAPPPHLIKCDAEGGEVEVFRGARGLLEEYRPVILCELHSAVLSDELTSIFQSADYFLESLDQNHWLATPRPKPE